MQFYYVEWSKGRSEIGMMLRQLIGLDGGPMPRKMIVSTWVRIQRIKKRVNLLLQNFVPCVYHSENACVQYNTKEAKGVLYRHICSACWAADNKAYGYSQVDCSHLAIK